MMMVNGDVKFVHNLIMLCKKYLVKENSNLLRALCEVSVCCLMNLYVDHMHNVMSLMLLWDGLA